MKDCNQAITAPANWQPPVRSTPTRVRRAPSGRTCAGSTLSNKPAAQGSQQGFSASSECCQRTRRGCAAENGTTTASAFDGLPCNECRCGRRRECPSLRQYGLQECSPFGSRPAAQAPRRLGRARRPCDRSPSSQLSSESEETGCRPLRVSHPPHLGCLSPPVHPWLRLATLCPPMPASIRRKPLGKA